MTSWISAVRLGLCLVTGSVLIAQPAGFLAPERLKVEGEVIRVPSPGYAAPCWADVTGDGEPDLLVGQFAEGAIRVFPGKDGELRAGFALKADGEVATVPGIW